MREPQYNQLKLTPEQCLDRLGWKVDNIKFNPSLKRGEADYWIIRQSSHDGTLIFERELIARAFEPLALQYSIKKGSQPFDIESVTYEVGYIYLTSVYGEVNVPAGKIRGQRQRLKMAVKAFPVYKTSNGEVK